MTHDACQWVGQPQKLSLRLEGYGPHPEGYVSADFYDTSTFSGTENWQLAKCAVTLRIIN